MTEQDLLNKIKELKALNETCDQIEENIRGICRILRVDWDREIAPPIDSIQRHIAGELRISRVELALVRGE